MNLRMTSNNILCKPVVEEPGVTEGGIILVTEPEDMYAKAEVVKTGPGYFDSKTGHEPMSCKPGDIVFLNNKYSATQKVKINGEDYFIAEDTDIVAFVD